MATAPVPQAAPPPGIDAKPIIPRTTANIWNRVLDERDRIYTLCKASVAAEGLDGLVLKSNFLQFPAWVKVELWLPVGSPGTTQRSSVIISLTPKPYHEYEFEYGVALDLQGKTKNRSGLLPLGSNDITDLIRYLLGKNSKVHFRQFRKVDWHFWQIKNKVKLFRSDYFAVAAKFSILLGLVCFSLAAANSVFGLLGFFLMLAGVVGVIYASKRRFVVKTEGKPRSEPRNLLRVDSWQTVIFGAGDQSTRFNDRFLQALKNPPTPKFHAHIETVWYWGLDGKEERDQIILTQGRAIVFVQVYRYGKDLYVGWDGHLNRGQWVEETIARGIDRSTSRPTAITCVSPGTQTVTEYDLIDLSCLMEWGHAQLVNLCKQFLHELKIDQEIDFKIQRGERQGLVAGEGDASGKKKSRFSFRRTG